MHNYN